MFLSYILKFIDTKPIIMYYSKIIILLSIISLFACKNTSTKETTAPKQVTIETQAKSSQEEPTTTPPVEEVSSNTKEITPSATAKEEDMTKEKMEQPVAAKKPANSNIQVKEVKKEVAEKASKVKTEATSAIKNTSVKVTEAKDKIVNAAKEATTNLPAPPVKVEKPKITTTTAPAAAKEVIEEPTKEVVEIKKELTHVSWDGLLRKYVSATGKVNYKGIKADKKFETYLQLLKDNPMQDGWSRNKKMAYLINAYNAFTIKLVADNYPVGSITNLHGGKPWDHKWIKLGDKTYTLNDLEHKILRPQFNDARIHFAVNCAAASCPPVLNRAWTASNLNSNLDKQTKLFINNAAFNNIDEKQVELSKIFEWYKEDFGDLITYINKYSNTKVKDNAKVSFREYDWALNE